VAHTGPDAQTRDVARAAGVSGLLSELQGARRTGLFITSDHPSGKPASTQEMSYGAGAAAFTLGTEGVIAELIGSASRNNVFVDHFRSADSRHDYYWEERWIRDEGYAKIVPEAVKAARPMRGGCGRRAPSVPASSLKGIGEMVAKKCGIAPSPLPMRSTNPVMPARPTPCQRRRHSTGEAGDRRSSSARPGLR
jgi:hypothetical protein